MSRVVVALLAAFALAGAPAARAEDAPEFELRVGEPVTAAPGTKGAASFTVVPAPGRTIHKGAGVTVRLAVAPPNGLKLARRRLGRADAADPQADAPRFEVAFTAETAGAYTIAAEVRFWICGARTCRPARGRAELTVTVAE